MDDATRSVKSMLDAAINARMPVMLVGAPGTGKTVSVKEIAKERGYKLITLVGSRMDPTDISGLPKAAPLGKDEHGKDIEATVYLSPYWQVEILRHKKVILFLDEFSNSSGAIQAAFLTILQEREFANGHKFPEETIIIGASNAVEEAADGYEMALPTTNRIFWISWNPTTESWVQGMLSGWGHELPAEEMKWKRKIAAFIKDQPTWLHRPPEDAGTTDVFGLNQNNASDMEVFRSAWASRRSWDNLSRVLSFAPEEVFIQDSIANGIIGYAATHAFRDWLRKNDNISPGDVMADPESIDWENISVNDANLIFRAIIEMITEDNALQAIKVFEVVADRGRANLSGSFMKDLLHRSMGMGQKFSAQSREAHKKALGAILPKYQSVSDHAQ